MKLRFLLLAGVTLLLVIGILSALELVSPVSPSQVIVQAISKPLSVLGLVSEPEKPKIHKINHPYPFTPEEQKMLDWRREEMAKDPFSDWKTPINFYGLVIDESNVPLSGANVEWISTNMHGNGRGTTSSGYDGRFFIETAGKFIVVTVRKDGYRPVEGQQGFEFAEFTLPNFYDHDKDHPVIFHLRKIPPFEPIYIWQYSSRTDLVGDKISIDPRTGKVVHGEIPEGMWIQFVPGPGDTPDREQYNIVLGTAEGGGVILQTGDADQIAPESGYSTMPLNTNLTVDYNGPRFINLSAFFKDAESHYGSVYFDIELLGHELTMGYTMRYNPGGGKSLSAPAHSEFQINKTQY